MPDEKSEDTPVRCRFYNTTNGMGFQIGLVHGMMVRAVERKNGLHIAIKSVELRKTKMYQT